MLFANCATCVEFFRSLFSNCQNESEAIFNIQIN